MKNTYINDQDLVNYPFAEGQQLPFPRHAVEMLHVAFYPSVHDSSFVVTTISVTGVEIGAGQITLTLAANDDTYIGGLTARSGGVCSFVTVVGGVKIHAMMEAGRLDSIPPMSVACALKLDPSCVWPCTHLLYDNNHNMLVVDGYTYPIGECLDIQFDGPLTTQFRTTYTNIHGDTLDYGPGWTTLDVEGWLAAGDGSFVTSQMGIYDMVTSINGVPVRGTASDVTPVLEFRVVPLSSEASGTDTMDRLKFGIVNGLEQDEIVEDADDLGPGVVISGFNDIVGNATVITVIGGTEIPNCYAGVDQSGHPDDPTLNPAPAAETDSASEQEPVSENDQGQ